MRFNKENIPPISIDPASRQPLAVQICESAIECIRRGKLSPGMPMPGQKTLADHLGVSYTTVVTAYSRLLAQGWIEMQWRSGTRVAQQLPNIHAKEPLAPAPNSTTHALAFDLPTRRDLATSRMIRIPPLSEGLPDPRLMPKGEMGQAYRAALVDAQTQTMPSPLGDKTLRDHLGQFLAERRGTSSDPDGILVTCGNRTALNLLAKSLLNPGDRVAVEDPGNPAAWEIFREAGAELCGLPVDEDGVNVVELERTLESHPIRLVYLTPRYHFPTTAQLSDERRNQLLLLAKRYDFWIVEEDSEADFTLEGPTKRALAAAPNDSKVIHLYSFSRLLAPGVRLGLILAPPLVIAHLVHFLPDLDGIRDSVLERTMALLFAHGDIQRHILRACKAYRERRDIASACLPELFGPKLEFTVPSGGLSLWIRVQPSIDLNLWQSRCAEWEIRFQPGRFYALNHRIIPAIRLGYAKFDPGELARILVQMREVLPG